MDNKLCDELIQEIFYRLSKTPSFPSVSLVSKRWLHLYRTSRTSLSLRLTLIDESTIPSLSSLLSHYPLLSSLSIFLSPDSSRSTSFNDDLLCLVSSFCSKLKHLRFLTGPICNPSLLSLANSCTLLTSLAISLSRPLSLTWVASFSCLKELLVYVLDGGGFEGKGFVFVEEIDADLGLESLALSGIRRDDLGVGWLWRSCKKLKKLQLKNCESVGDGGSFVSFSSCLKDLQEVELRASRSVVDGVLLKLADKCESLTSLLVYDGGSSEALLQFISNCRFDLQKLDLRLPLDLNNNHLLAVALNFRGLLSVRLQSCCLVTGEGLKALGIALSSGLQELALINCDVVERESGLLATLGQNLRQLRKLDLSHNELLIDKEFTSMLVSCNYLIELKLRGCKKLTNVAILSMFKSCKELESVDIMHCSGIGTDAIELFFMNSLRLRSIQVEENKLSIAARTWAANKFIEISS